MEEDEEKEETESTATIEEEDDISTIDKYIPQKEVNTILSALKFSKNAHNNQKYYIFLYQPPYHPR